jgi:hypothetical protein
MVWSFVEACARGQLPVADCSPLYQFAVIVLLLPIAVAVLIRLVRQQFHQ